VAHTIDRIDANQNRNFLVNVSVPNSLTVYDIYARSCNSLGCNTTPTTATTAPPCQPPHTFLKNNLCWACPSGSSSTTTNATACFGSCGNIDGANSDFASCISGTNHLKTSLDSVTCAANTCVVNDCCDSNPTCGDINGDGSNAVFDSCGGSEAIKNAPSSITCTTGTCATSDCCTQATCAQITDGASGGDFVCGAGFTIKSTKITIDCGATPCLANSDPTQNNACCDDVDGCTLDSDGCAGDAQATCSLGNGVNLRTCTCAAGYTGTDASLADASSFAGCTENVVAPSPATTAPSPAPPAATPSPVVAAAAVPSPTTTTTSPPAATPSPVVVAVAVPSPVEEEAAFLSNSHSIHMVVFNVMIVFVAVVFANVW